MPAGRGSRPGSEFTRAPREGLARGAGPACPPATMTAAATWARGALTWGLAPPPPPARALSAPPLAQGPPPANQAPAAASAPRAPRPGARPARPDSRGGEPSPPHTAAEGGAGRVSKDRLTSQPEPRQPPEPPTGHLPGIGCRRLLPPALAGFSFCQRGGGPDRLAPAWAGGAGQPSSTAWALGPSMKRHPWLVAVRSQAQDTRPRGVCPENHSSS